MANQDANPPKWTVANSDGCSGPLIFKWLFSMWKKYCHKHDERYWYGGTWEDKLWADDALYYDIYHDGFWGRRFAAIIYWHIRAYTYNFPTGHPNRSWREYTKGKAFNFLGPGMYGDRGKAPPRPDHTR